MFHKELPKEKELIAISEASKMLGISTATLYRYEKRGIIVPLRTAGGHRRYSIQQIMMFKKRMSEDFIQNRSKRTVAKGGTQKDV